MNYRIILFIGLASTLFVLNACDTKIELETLEGKITEIVAPETIRKGQTASVDVFFQGKNGCSRPKEVTYGQTKNVITVKSFYTHPTDSRVTCTQVIPEFDEPILIEAQIEGYLYIRASGNPLIYDSILVVE